MASSRATEVVFAFVCVKLWRSSCNCSCRRRYLRLFFSCACPSIRGLLALLDANALLPCYVPNSRNIIERMAVNDKHELEVRVSDRQSHGQNILPTLGCQYMQWRYTRNAKESFHRSGRGVQPLVGYGQEAHPQRRAADAISAVAARPPTCFGVGRTGWSQDYTRYSLAPSDSSVTQSRDQPVIRHLDLVQANSIALLLAIPGQNCNGGEQRR